MKICHRIGLVSVFSLTLTAIAACESDAPSKKSTRLAAASAQSEPKKSQSACDRLAEALCQEVGPETEACTVFKLRTQEAPASQCQAMLEHVDTIAMELQQQEQANRPISDDLQAKIAASDAPSFGPAQAKVTIVEFSDFECPYCSRAAAVNHQIKEKYADKVRVVFRQFPLSFHENAKSAAVASLAAHAQGKFWDYHDKLFQNQRNLRGEALMGFARELGLDVKRFGSDLASKELESQVDSDVALGGVVGVQGTPTMFVNGKRVGNPSDFSEVSMAIDVALGT